MDENETNFPNQQVTERQRAIVEAGNLIDALANECPSIERIQATWHQTELRICGAITELRQREATAQASDKERESNERRS